MNYLPKLENHNGIYVVSSRVIANQLEKRHDNVMRDLDKILETSNLSSLIIPNLYRVSNQIRTYREYLLTKDGFTLYMFNIQGYNDFKLAYINEFNRMEQILNSQQNLPIATSSVMIPLDKVQYWNKIKELSDMADERRSEIYNKLKLLSKMVVSITTEVDRLSDIVFETEYYINKIEGKDMNLKLMLKR